jgi:site-specific DNA-methyltransferase (adenine-specific)
MSGSFFPKSKTDKWATPPELYLALDKRFFFDFDPCPIEWQPGDADGLEIPWGERTFVNPPYSKVALWIKKAHDEWKLGKTVVMLINAITDTEAFHKYILGNAQIEFVKGRVSFVNPLEPEKKRQPNVRPSMIVIFTPTMSPSVNSSEARGFVQTAAAKQTAGGQAQTKGAKQTAGASRKRAKIEPQAVPDQ